MLTLMKRNVTPAMHSGSRRETGRKRSYNPLSVSYSFIHPFITFCVSRRRRKMYCGHARLCVCVCACLSAAVRPHYCMDPHVTLWHGRGCLLVVHYWVDLQSGHGLRCYGNITRTLVTSLRGWLAGDWPSTGAFSTLLRQSGLRASTGGVLVTKSERKMLASTCLYSLYAWFIQH